MKFIEFTVHTTTEGSELIADIFWNYTNYGVTVCDVNDIIALQSDKRTFWDYMDDDLIKGQSDVLVKCFLPLDIADENIRSILADIELLKERSAGIFSLGTLETSRREIEGDDWIDVWKKHFRPLHIGGHGDLLGGAVISNDEQFLRECRLGTLMHFGSVMAPFTAFLVCRGLKTLGVRMKQYNESALKIAKWLEANPKIETVRYPFLESNPQYAIAKKQMKGGGGMISFDVAGGLEAGKKFINSLKLCTLAVSLGDTETLVEQAAAMTHTMIPKEIREAAGITDGMIRMSVGLEDPDDIIADLKQALGD